VGANAITAVETIAITVFLSMRELPDRLSSPDSLSGTTDIVPCRASKLIAGELRRWTKGSREAGLRSRAHTSGADLRPTGSARRVSSFDLVGWVAC
jgi:hypothetical protein